MPIWTGQFAPPVDAVTVTVACPERVGSTLVAVTVQLRGSPDAVSVAVAAPVESDPHVVAHVTERSLAPVTVAVNAWVAPTTTVADTGATATCTPAGPPHAARSAASPTTIQPPHHVFEATSNLRATRSRDPQRCRCE